MNYFDNFIIGAVMAPTALFLNAFASFQLPESLQKLSPLIPALQSNWLMMHVTVMLFSYATLICGCILAITFLFLFESQFENIFNHSNTFFVENTFNASLFEAHDSQKKEQTQGSIDQGAQREGDANSSLRDDLQNLGGQSVNSTPMNLTRQPPDGTKGLEARPVKVKLDQGIDPRRSGFRQYPIPSGLLPREGRQRRDELGQAKRWLLLKKLDQLSFRSIGIGFPFLTIGILSGSVWANEAWGSYWNWDPKETWSLITWLIFAIYLHLRLTQNWNSLKSAILATVGFFSVWICFLGVNFLAKGLHSYGWFYS